MVLVPTEQDASWLASQVPGIEPVIVPLGLGRPADRRMPTAGVRRDDVLLFVGNFAHPPNRDAARWLATEILPEIRGTRPEVQLWLVGKDPTPEIVALAGPAVVVTGEVPHVAPYLRECTLFVAPLRQGGGTRMKVLEALTAGTPVISTAIGAAGLPVSTGRHLLIAETTEDFVEQILRLLADPAARHTLGAAASCVGDANDVARLAQLDDVLRRSTRRD